MSLDSSEKNSCSKIVYRAMIQHNCQAGRKYYIYVETEIVVFVCEISSVWTTRIGDSETSSNLQTGPNMTASQTRAVCAQ